MSGACSSRAAVEHHDVSRGQSVSLDGGALGAPGSDGVDVGHVQSEPIPQRQVIHSVDVDDDRFVGRSNWSVDACLPRPKSHLPVSSFNPGGTCSPPAFDEEPRPHYNPGWLGRRSLLVSTPIFNKFVGRRKGRHVSVFADGWVGGTLCAQH